VELRTDFAKFCGSKKYFAEESTLPVFRKLFVISSGSDIACEIHFFAFPGGSNMCFRGKIVRFAFFLVLCSLLGTVVDRPQIAYAADPQSAPEGAKKSRPRGRLPKYYATVVNEKQREDIYRIQEEYELKLKALQAQLDAMKKEKDQKIEAVLTPEQKKKLDAAEIASIKRKLEKKEKAAESPPVPPNAKPAEKNDQSAEKTETATEKTKKGEKADG
jgi:hypothetical protein